MFYHLYEERPNQELGVYQKVYGQSTGEESLEELIDNHVKEDASMHWGKADIELEESAQNDPQLQVLTEHNQLLQRNLLVEALKKRHSNATDEQLEALASYIMGLTELAFRLRHKSKFGEKELIYDVTADLKKRVAEFTNNL